MSIIITREYPNIQPGIILPGEHKPIWSAGDHRKDCCKNPANLEYHEVSADTICYRCRHCGCRHFEMNAEAGKYGLR